jgi:hypothetical protein
VVVAGNIYFAPPPAGATPRISAATAFVSARHTWGDPQGTAMPEVVLISYTNDGQGDMLPGGGIRRFDVDRLVWAVVDQGAGCAPVGPADPDPQEQTPQVFNDCLVISCVDARTGQPDGHMDEFGRGVPVFDFGASVSPEASPWRASPEPRMSSLPRTSSVPRTGSRP